MFVVLFCDAAISLNLVFIFIYKQQTKVSVIDAIDKKNVETRFRRVYLRMCVCVCRRFLFQCFCLCEFVSALYSSCFCVPILQPVVSFTHFSIQSVCFQMLNSANNILIFSLKSGQTSKTKPCGNLTFHGSHGLTCKQY